jgi:hypothetical protein
VGSDEPDSARDQNSFFLHLSILLPGDDPTTYSLFAQVPPLQLTGYEKGSLRGSLCV